MQEAATCSRTDTLPMLGYRTPEDPMLLDAPGRISAGQFVAQARALAAELPEGTHVVNLCESRHAFLVAFGAALLRGRVSMLPPGHARGDWQRLLTQYPGATLLGDVVPADAPAAFLDVSRYLAIETVSPDVPRVDAAAPAAILFTSGSTGEPVAHTKTWGQLWSGAQTWAEVLGWGEARGIVVIGSVQPQHMFGLEATVMLPLRAGVPMHAHRPLLPSDVEAALASSNAAAWWMATPLHLRACLASSFAPAGLAGIVSSTMSLPAASARAAEERWGVAVHEIYGSTETGAVALRRPARDEAWTPLPDVRLEPGEAGVRVSGERIGEPVVLNDILEPQPGGRLLWRGRTSDLVKVGGKRESLSALDRRLQEISGVEDGAFFLPEGAGELARLAAFYVSATVDAEAVTEALRSQVDAVFLPRPLYRVAALPRGANGKLSRPALAALYDACHAPERFTVPATHPSIAGHFPGDPIVPGALILERVAQVMRAQFPGKRPGVLASARFHAPLRPDEAAMIEARRDGNRVTFEVRRGETLLASGIWRLD
ncbi:hypothetical protein BWI17_12630 [Betaproteobacteria bacterium GR16-43]|nr:hypothetical protein BWI17_12630 [Betaproteobacteria bacterium GR16-43]